MYATREAASCGAFGAGCLRACAAIRKRQAFNAAQRFNDFSTVQTFNFSIISPPFNWRNAGRLCEDVPEGALVAVAALLRDERNREVGVREQTLRLAHSDVKYLVAASIT